MLPVPSSPDNTVARLHWIDHLHRHGLRVPELIRAEDDALLQCVELPAAAYCGYAYLALPIDRASRLDGRDPAMVHALGRAMARMHALAIAYLPPAGTPSLPHWREADWLRQPGRVLHPSQTRVAEAIERLRDTVARFPAGPDTYGPIHDDLHTGNVFLLDGELVIIDFDCCHHSWYAADIASALLFRVWIGPEKERPGVADQGRAFLRALLDGYATVLAPPREWASLLPALLKLREASLLLSFYRDADARSTSDALFRYLYASIAEDRPFLALDPGAI